MEQNNQEKCNVGFACLSQWTKRVIFSAVIVVFCTVLLILLEAVAKKVYPKFPPNGRAATESLRGKDDTFRTGEYLQHPYLYYTYRPGYRGQFNATGHRNPDVSSEPANGVLRILCIGGSTTVSFPYVGHLKDAWPLKLGRLVAQQSGLKVEAINAGLNGANSADLLAHYMFRNRYLKPHIVVIHVGGNDAMPLLFPEYTPEYTHFTKGWKNTALAARPFESKLLKSHLARCFYAWWLKDVSLEADIGRECIPKLSPADCLKNASMNEPTGFRRNLELLVQNVINDGAVPVLYPFVRASDDIFHDEFGKYSDALMISLVKNVAVMDEISIKYGIDIVKMVPGSIPKKFFHDWCHVYTEGDAIKAEVVAKGVMPIIRKMIDEGKFSVTNTPSISDRKVASAE